MPACRIAPSVLSADFAFLADESKQVLKDGADWLHLDVMDGHFVPNLTIGAPVVKSLRGHTDAFLDCHLMVENPERWVEDFSKAGANQYTFHIEAAKDPEQLIKDIKSHGMRAAIAVKPNTPLEAVKPFLSQLDMVLIMTVEPGFGGQEFMGNMMPKVKELRSLCPNLDIQVDGGLSPETIDEAAAAGANVIVAGSAVFKHKGNYGKVITTLREAVNKVQNT